MAPFTRSPCHTVPNRSDTAPSSLFVAAQIEFRDVALNLVAIYKTLGGGWQAGNQQAMK